MNAFDLLDHALRPTADPGWIISEDGSDPLRESSRATRFAISNGFLGVRADQAINRGAPGLTAPCTYVAGLFDTPEGKPAIPALVPAPDWLQVCITVRGEPLMQCPGGRSERLLTLDMKRGMVLTEYRQFNADGTRLRLRSLRLVSLRARAIGLEVIQMDTDRADDEVAFEATFDGTNMGLIAERMAPDLGVWRTSHSGKSLAIAAAVSMRIDGQLLPATMPGQFRWLWRWKIRPGQVTCVERMVGVARSDIAGEDPGAVAQEALATARSLGWQGVLANHAEAWSDRWDCSDIEIEGDPAAQQALRFALYHLNGAVDPDDESNSIGARALTGSDYLGHVFWDTEIFLLPFYTLTWPKAARSLLMYRYHTLDSARAKAAGMGWRGALYAWEAADTGAEATPEQVIGPDRKIVEVLSGKQEQHISADVAYAVWQYWQATGDHGFLRDAGAEILFETARFWSSRAVLERDGRRHIRGVIGPDEYHETIDDNAFTNVMARWNIRRALEVATVLRDRWPATWRSLSEKLHLDDSELQQWQNVSETIASGLDHDTGLFEQFRGFFDLQPVNLADYGGRSVPMDVVLGRERTRRSQVVKQADVVALLALLPEAFDQRTAVVNYRYYEPRCSHGSSLSRPMHGLVAARLGYCGEALRFFRETAAIDLADTHVAIAGGIHIAALGGIWQMAVFGFAGVSLRPDGVSIDPKLPDGWLSLKCGLQWHGRKFKLKIDPAQKCVEVTLLQGEPMTIVIQGEPYQVHGTHILRVELKSRQTPIS